MMTDRGAHGGTGAAGGPVRHIPALLPAVLNSLAPRDHKRYIDGTFGAGGYSRALLEAASCRVLAIDRDPDAIAEGQALVKEFPERLTLVSGNFADLLSLARERDFLPVHGVVLDLGVSSMQLDRPERGFSFQQDGPLDMRMGQAGPTAADVVNHASEAVLTTIFRTLGEERRARAIARAIVAKRREAPFTRTKQLADVILAVLGKPKPGGKHPATRSFQALRLYVNRELEALVAALAGAEAALAPGGRLAVVTFHSLEDRIVKRFFQARSRPPPQPSRHIPLERSESFSPSFRILHKKPITPDSEELAANPRVRSAKLRVGERTEAPPQPLDPAALGLPTLPDWSRRQR